MTNTNSKKDNLKFSDDFVIEFIRSYVDGQYLETVRRYYPDNAELVALKATKSASQWAKKIGLKWRRTWNSKHDWERIRNELKTQLTDSTKVTWKDVETS